MTGLWEIGGESYKTHQNCVLSFWNYLIRKAFIVSRDGLEPSTLSLKGLFPKAKKASLFSMLNVSKHKLFSPDGHQNLDPLRLGNRTAFRAWKITGFGKFVGNFYAGFRPVTDGGADYARPFIGSRHLFHFTITLPQGGRLGVPAPGNGRPGAGA